MSTAQIIWGNDFRNIVRDRTINVLLFVPLIFLVLLRYGIPLIESELPSAAGYRPLALGLFCMISGMFPAFMQSFLMLDEKEQKLFAAFQVLPVSIGKFFGLRLALVGALSFCYPLLLLAASGLVDYSPLALLIIPLLCALRSIATGLVTLCVAENKIEGLAVFKALFLVVAVAMVGFISSDSWVVALKVLPSYWIFAAFVATDTPTLLESAAIAGGLHLLVAVVFYRRFFTRVL